MKKRRAAIVAPVRTAVGAFGKSLKDVQVENLASAVVKETVSRSGIDPNLIEDVIFAQSYSNSEVPCVGRWAALEAGLSEAVPGMHVDRRCGGGLQAIINAVMMVESGACDVVVAGGVESMSNIEYYSTNMRWGKKAGSFIMHDRLDRGRERSQPESRFGYISGMIETAENLAEKYSIGREESDRYALMSQERAFRAWESGRFNEEVVPIHVRKKNGESLLFSRDEGVRENASMEGLEKLNPIIPGGTVTAGNASQQSDAAAACIVISEDKLREIKCDPSGFMVGWAASGCHPAYMGIGPVPAVEKLLRKISLKLDDIDLIEVNEAFACQVLAVLKEWKIDDFSKINVNGSGISLGHPIGATGSRIMVSMLHEMQRRSHCQFGLETMCVGGGQGVAAIFEKA
ncbi:acetyl-CoA C-acetyltransferase [Halomonas sp. Y3]|uniref:acetyl-CoA C-acetyltransferase n=1 Tax=Halomonas sp. Y3 TaxID=2956797 RepID=UPI00209CD528|nr:acetyl-CoA C-acetyltransferase [Halomonas sp. Y3]